MLELLGIDHMAPINRGLLTATWRFMDLES